MTSLMILFVFKNILMCLDCNSIVNALWQGKEEGGFKVPLPCCRCWIKQPVRLLPHSGCNSGCLLFAYHEVFGAYGLYEK